MRSPYAPPMCDSQCHFLLVLLQCRQERSRAVEAVASKAAELRWKTGHRQGEQKAQALHDRTEVILMPCEAAVKKLRGSTLAQKRDAHDEVSKEWVTAFMHVKEDPAAHTSS